LGIYILIFLLNEIFYKELFIKPHDHPQREVADEAGAEGASVALEDFFVEGDLGATSAACSSE
jgi:hypothetical protein